MADELSLGGNNDELTKKTERERETERGATNQVCMHHNRHHPGNHLAITVSLEQFRDRVGSEFLPLTESARPVQTAQEQAAEEASERESERQGSASLSGCFRDCCWRMAQPQEQDDREEEGREKREKFRRGRERGRHTLFASSHRVAEE